MNETLLQSKVSISGTEEAHTQFAEAKQRLVQAVDAFGDKSDSAAKQYIDNVLSQIGVGPMQELRQFSRQYKRELEDIVKSFQANQQHQKQPKPITAAGRAGQKGSGAPGEKGKPGALSTLAGRAVGDPSRAISGIMRTLGGALPMGIGGLVGLMLYGVAKDQELQAQANRFTQIFEESVRGFGGSGENRAREAAGRLAEVSKELELQFRATRGEIEGVARAFATSGIGAEEIERDLVNPIGAEQKNLFMLSLTLERHFELAGGTVAKQAADFMTKFGLDTEQAADTIIKLNVAGSQSGVGLAQFTSTISQAAGAVRFLGVDARDVIDLTSQLQKAYGEMGISKHMAGQLATTGVQQMMQGFASLNIGEQVLVAEKAGLGRGLEARYALAERMLRQGGPDPRALEQYVRSVYELYSERAHGDKNLTRLTLESKFGFEGARAIVHGVELLEKIGSFENVKKEQLSEIAKGLQTEEQKTSDFKRSMEEMLRGMSEIGMAMFNTFTALLADQILSIRLFAAMLSGDSAGTTAIAKSIADHQDVIPNALTQAKKGLSRFRDAAGEIDLTGLDLIAESLKGIGTPSAGPARQAVNAVAQGTENLESGTRRFLSATQQKGAGMMHTMDRQVYGAMAASSNRSVRAAGQAAQSLFIPEEAQRREQTQTIRTQIDIGSITDRARMYKALRSGSTRR